MAAAADPLIACFCALFFADRLCQSDILSKVVEFMQHHKGTEPPILEKPLRSKVRREEKREAIIRRLTRRQVTDSHSSLSLFFLLFFCVIR